MLKNFKLCDKMSESNGEEYDIRKACIAAHESINREQKKTTN